MYTNCDEIFKITIPAVRIAVAKSLAKNHDMNQSVIAKRLGIAQAAVSKYLSSKYSSKISKIEKLIQSKRLEQPIVRLIVSKKGKEKVLQEIDRLASSGFLVKAALKTM